MLQCGTLSVAKAVSIGIIWCGF